MKADDLNQWLAIAALLAPAVLTRVKGGEKIAPFIPAITQGVIEAEQIKGASGAQKKAHVLNLVPVAVGVANATGKTHLDPVVIGSIVDSGIDAVIKAVNAVHATHVDPPALPSAL